MPQTFIKYTNKKMDARFKIYPDQYPAVKLRYKQLKSLRKVGKEYGVDKKIISFIVNPSALERQKKYNKGRWSIYYEKEKHRQSIKKFRDKKRKLKLVIKN